MSDKAKVGAANTTITLGGQDYQLVPTLAAAQGISRLHGGIRSCIDAVIKVDIDTIVAVVKFGMGPKQVKEIGNDKLPDLVWSEGMTDSSGELVLRCVEFLSILLNGGRPVNKPTEGEEETNPQSG